MAEERPRVVVTGMGVVTPMGETVETYREALFAGRSGVTRWKNADRYAYSKVGGDLSDFDFDAHLSRVGEHYPAGLLHSARKLMRPTPFSGRVTGVTALQAFVAAGLGDGSVDRTRVAHVLAGHNLNSGYIYDQHLQFLEEPEYIDPLYGVVGGDTDILSVVSELLEVRGPSLTTGAACASGNVALLSALDLLRLRRADAVIVSGGAPDPEPPGLHAWAIIDAITFRSFNETPARASRPFDALREGFVPSQGCGVVVLETLEHARRRGAPVRAEILGGAAGSDASRQPKPDVEGQVRTMQLALRDAAVDAERIGYVNAHATSTPLGDTVEVMAIKRVFGDHAYRIPVNATKSMLGHCFSAAGIVELIATVLQMEAGVVHPTINQEVKDPELDLDFVPNQARPHRFDTAISNAFGFGGLNSCIVVGRVP